jgi:L-ascorbate metabolism protein UlaG (beta-lactamase superfamily)
MLKGKEHTVYFGADSGYGNHFSEIGRLFPGIDYALLGIGAYRPDYMMQEIHTNPAEAARAYRELHASYLIPMHYGTYDLSDEPVSEPYRFIQAEFEGQADRLKALAVNEPLYLTGATEK